MKLFCTRFEWIVWKELFTVRLRTRRVIDKILSIDCVGPTEFLHNSIAIFCKIQFVSIVAVQNLNQIYRGKSVSWFMIHVSWFSFARSFYFSFQRERFLCMTMCAPCTTCMTDVTHATLGVASSTTWATLFVAILHLGTLSGTSWVLCKILHHSSGQIEWAPTTPSISCS